MSSLTGFAKESRKHLHLRKLKTVKKSFYVCAIFDLNKISNVFCPSTNHFSSTIFFYHLNNHILLKCFKRLMETCKLWPTYTCYKAMHKSRTGGMT